MKKKKIRLERWELIKGLELDKRLMLKVFGGDEEPMKTQPNQCNTPCYTYSAQLMIDVEANKEK